MRWGDLKVKRWVLGLSHGNSPYAWEPGNHISWVGLRVATDGLRVTA